MEKSKVNSFWKRLAAAVVLAPVTLYVLYLGTPFLGLFMFMCAAFLAWEWVSMLPNQRPVFYAVAYLFAAGAATLLPVPLLQLILGVIVLTMLVVWRKSRGEEHRRLLMLGVPYIALGTGALVWLSDITNFVIVIWYVLTVWSVDVGAYLAGTALRGPKLAPKISPNKTWAGLVGGVLLAAAVSFAYTSWWQINYNWEFAAAAAVVAVVSQIGDLAESKIKRIAGVKDSSNLIPGHGGVFDRMDGLMFAVPFVFAAFVVLFYVKLGM